MPIIEFPTHLELTVLSGRVNIGPLSCDTCGLAPRCIPDAAAMRSPQGTHDLTATQADMTVDCDVTNTVLLGRNALCGPRTPRPKVGRDSNHARPLHRMVERRADRWLVEVAALAGSALVPTATQVLAELEKLRTIVLDGSETDSGKSPSTIAPASLVTLSYAAESLTDEERRELAARLAAGVALCGERELETEAVGLFLLARPLMDLQFHGLASKREINRFELGGVLRSFARLAGGVDTRDPAVDLFAFGPAEQGSNAPALGGGSCDPPRGDKLCDLALEVWDCAAGLGLNIPAVPDTEPSVMSVERLCETILPVVSGQFARWSASAYDVVLEMAGYLDGADAVPWWSGRGIRWQR